MKQTFSIILIVLLGILFLPRTAFANEEFATSAKACVVFEANSGRLLYEKNKDEKLPEASTTKIMTALVVAENSDVEKIISIPKQAVGIEGSSIYLREGEKLSIKELLFGLMLRSGNDCAVALALEVGGSIDNFANMMNEKAKAIGCKNTNFTNPHGLHDDNHYTSAYDLGLISCAAIKNEVVNEIVSSKNATISNDGYNYDRQLINKNKILSKFEGANGIKTGYTKKAGRCFVGSAYRNGMQLVVVLLNCAPMFEESTSLMQTCFDLYEMKQLLSLSDIYHTIATQNKKHPIIEAKTVGSCFYPLKKDGSEDNLIKKTSTINKDIKMISKVGDVVGKTEVFFDNRLIYTTEIKIIRN